MTRHTLSSRSENEILWHKRRSFLQAAAAWTTMGGMGMAQAQSRSNVVELQGEALLNGKRLRPEQIIQTGDEVRTGPASTLIFVMGNASFHVRQNSLMQVDRGQSLSAVGVLRLLSGAVASVWSKGVERRIITPTLTAGIRGTGVYTEVFAKDDYRTYFCNCYGTVDLTASGDTVVSRADYHQAFWGEATPKNGRSLSPAKAINHTDEEIEALARLVNQRTAWQIAGHKGIKDGSGYMDGSVTKP
jgi:hypothetical protein